MPFRANMLNGFVMSKNSDNKKWKRVEKLIKTLGFVYQRMGNHGKLYKHPERKCCVVQIPFTPSDHRVVMNFKSGLKKTLTQDCVPAFNLKEVKEELNTIFLEQGLKSTGENTIGDMIDDCFSDVSLTAKIDPEYKERLKRIADSKGISMGDLIEEMMVTYEKTQ